MSMIITTPINQLSPYNNRQYTADILVENIQRLTSAINERRLMGTFYCEDYYGNEFDLQRVSHLITNMAVIENDLVAKIKILETPFGKVLQYSINRGIKFRLGPVGYGILKEDNITFEEYTLERIDLITDGNQ